MIGFAGEILPMFNSNFALMALQPLHRSNPVRVPTGTAQRAESQWNMATTKTYTR